MPQHNLIRVQEPLDAILRARRLALIQLRRLDRAGDAFPPADVREVVHSCW